MAAEATTDPDIGSWGHLTSRWSRRRAAEAASSRRGWRGVGENARGANGGMTRVYYDNMIASAKVLRDLRPESEKAALEMIESWHTSGRIKRVTSRESWREQERTRDDAKREMLKNGQDLVSVVQDDHRLLGFNHQDFGSRGFIASPILTGIVDQDLFDALRAEGLKDADARHLMYAARNACDVFLTTDPDFLDRRVALEAICSGTIRIMRPSEFSGSPLRSI